MGSMKKSWIKKVIFLLMCVLLTSILFFAIITISYYAVYKQRLLEVNNEMASSWTTSTDSRLNTVYEHMYDLAATLFKKAEVRSGSDRMDYKLQKEIQDAINLKLMTSSDITAFMVLDTESELILYADSGVVPQPMSFALKLFLSEYGVENSVSINRKEWDVVSVLEHTFFIKTFGLGKYIVGAVSDVNNYSTDNLSTTSEETALFLKSDDDLFYCYGNKDLSGLVSHEKESDYFRKKYAVSFSSHYSAEATAILVTRQKGFKVLWKLSSAFLIVDSALCVVLVGMLFFNIDRKVRVPIKNLVEATEELAKGNLEYRLKPEEAGSEEFEELYSSFNDMSQKIGNLTIESYELKINREENRLKMLRAQMQPHSFLNAITTISNMTYTGEPESIRKYIGAFAGFTRYMLHTANDWTTVEEELNHIKNYVSMQKIRFPNSIEIKFDCPEEVMLKRIPYLILFSLVENSFKHAMTLVNTMYVSIKGEVYCEEGFEGIRLIEEDNGAGFSEEAFTKLSNADNDDPFTKEHLGLTNVRYSLNLIYDRDDLLRLSNKPEGGARIELLIPDTDEREKVLKDETAGL